MTFWSDLSRGLGFTFALLLLSATALPGAKPEAASIASVAGARVIAPPASYAFPGEKYVFSVQWHMFNAGTSTVMMQRAGSGVHVTATADSAGFPDKLYKVHDLFNGDVNPHTFCTLHVSKHNQEGDRRRDYNIVLDYARAKSLVDITDLKTSETRHSEFDIPSCVTDVISGFFYLASLPLQPGFSQIFPVNDNGKTSDIKIEVEGREHIKGPTGEYQALRVKAEPVAGAMKGKGTLWVWFSDDRRHIPVQMKSKLGFATLSFQLQQIEPRAGGAMAAVHPR
jgi:hypothetical protein